MNTTPTNNEQLREAASDGCCSSSCCSTPNGDTVTTTPTNDDQLREAVRERYAHAALQVLDTGEAASDSCCSTPNGDAITSDLYSSAELGELPVPAALASLGCGNPIALVELHAGEKVLDLGSGGGIDVLLSARRVGPGGFAYGLDMTDAMLELAERNRVEAKVENARFLRGIIEDIPLPDQSVDVVISNCVINLSADKGQVLREAYRVLSPGGRFAVSDIVVQGRMPQAMRGDLEAWAGCLAGALEEDTYRRLLVEAGFTDVEVEVTRHYSLQDAAEGGAGVAVAALSAGERDEVDGRFVSAFIRGRKPVKV